MTVPITYSQAVTGADVVVPTIDGKVQYTVPEGTQSGTVFRLRGKGIQYVNGTRPRRPVCQSGGGNSEKAYQNAARGTARF